MQLAAHVIDRLAAHFPGFGPAEISDDPGVADLTRKLQAYIGLERIRTWSMHACGPEQHVRNGLGRLLLLVADEVPVDRPS